jgi:hypothetical protein
MKMISGPLVVLLKFCPVHIWYDVFFPILMQSWGVGEFFAPGTRDPTNKIVRKITSLIKMSHIPDDMKKKLTPHAATPPQMYGLPKIHKEGIPLRPTVNCIGSPTYDPAKYLVKQLKPLVGQSEHHIMNLKMFVQKLKAKKVRTTDTLVSFNVK